MESIYPKRIIFVRHAQSLLNAAKAHLPVHFLDNEHRAPFVGIPDHRIDITALGESQASITGEALLRGGTKIDHAYHSGYLRTVRTLDRILKAFPDKVREEIPVHQEILFREREPGFTYGLTREEVKTQFPWLQQYWDMQGPVFARPPGGESMADVIQRLQLVLPKFHRDMAGQTVLASVHGRVLSALRFLYEGWTYEQLEDFLKQKGPRNCSLTVYEYDDMLGRMVLKEYNTVHWK